VRKEEAGWRERLFVRALPASGEFPKLPKRQLEVWNIVEERREISLTELLELAETTAATVRKLEDRGLIALTSEISERDPYAKEHILPSQPLILNPSQATALEKIKAAMDRGVDEGLKMEDGKLRPSATFLLHGIPEARQRFTFKPLPRAGAR
jgi:primosomal protein N'